MKKYPNRELTIDDKPYRIRHKAYSTAGELCSKFILETNHKPEKEIIFNMRFVYSPVASCGHHTIANINSILDAKDVYNYKRDQIIKLFHKFIMSIRKANPNDWQEPRYNKKNFICLTTNKYYKRLKEIIPAQWIIDESKGHENYSSTNKVIIFVLHIPDEWKY